MLRVLVTLMFAFSSVLVSAQSYSVDIENSKVVIDGTSNVHDWESVAEQFSGNATIVTEEDSLISISDLQFNVVVDGIKSGKGGMDKKTYDALDKDKYPNITFVLTEVTSMSDTMLTAAGDLTISGVTKTIQMDVKYEILPDGSVLFNGTQNINMKDYDVDPPKAMFGAIKAGEEVDVIFDAKFIQ